MGTDFANSLKNSINKKQCYTHPDSLVLQINNRTVSAVSETLTDDGAAVGVMPGPGAARVGGPLVPRQVKHQRVTDLTQLQTGLV